LCQPSELLLRFEEWKLKNQAQQPLPYCSRAKRLQPQLLHHSIHPLQLIQARASNLTELLIISSKSNILHKNSEWQPLKLMRTQCLWKEQKERLLLQREMKAATNHIIFDCSISKIVKVVSQCCKSLFSYSQPISHQWQAFFFFFLMNNNPYFTELSFCNFNFNQKRRL
jgi:hypothetical protein